MGLKSCGRPKRPIHALYAQKHNKNGYDSIYTYRSQNVSDVISQDIRTVDTASDWLIANYYQGSFRCVLLRFNIFESLSLSNGKANL